MDIFRSFPKPQKEERKRTLIRKIGKRGRVNIKANRELRKEYEGEIATCEILGPNCLHIFQGFAHKHKRIWYRGREELLSSRQHTLKSCIPCHQMIEASRTLTDMYFRKLRPEIDSSNYEKYMDRCGRERKYEDREE